MTQPYHYIQDDLGFDGYAWIMVWKLMRISEMRWLQSHSKPFSELDDLDIEF